MEQWFREFIEDLINKSGHLTESALEVITDNVGNDNIAFKETHTEQIEYLKEILNNDNL